MIKQGEKHQKYISLREAAWLYGCTQRHMNLMARKEKLRAIKIGRNWFTTLKWLKEYMVSLEGKRKMSIFSFKKIFITSLLVVFIFFALIGVFFIFSKNEGFYKSKTELALILSSITSRPIPGISEQSYLSIKHLYQRLRKIESFLEEIQMESD